MKHKKLKSKGKGKNSLKGSIRKLVEKTMRKQTLEEFFGISFFNLIQKLIKITTN